MKQPIFVVILSFGFLVLASAACQNSYKVVKADDHSQAQLEEQHDELVRTITTKPPTSKWSDEQLDGYDQAISQLERLGLQLSGTDRQELNEKLEESEAIIRDARKTLSAVRAEKAKFLSGHEAVQLFQKVNDRVQSIFSEMETLIEPDQGATVTQLNAYLKKLEEVRSQLAEQSAIMSQHPELFTENSKLKDQTNKILGSVDTARRVVSQRLLKNTL